MPTFTQDVLTAPARLMLGYADLVAQGVPADRFARMPEGVQTNHPAFVYGHLAIYPDRMLAMIDREELAQPDERFDALFAAGEECRDDPEGTIYPPMDEILGRFRERHEAAISAIASVPDEVLYRPNPNERMASRFPTIGAAITFLLGGHAMMHLGQVSAWRRMMGLGPAM